MADPKHVTIVKEGIKTWNSWKRENSKVKPDLSGANLSQTNLTSADLREADLIRTDLTRADLTDADLTRANLSGAKLSSTRLTRADLTNALLISANLSGANLTDAELGGAKLFHTIFAAVDIRSVNGLESVTHIGPSSIGIDTLYESNGEIPEVFLRGAGVPETFITFARSLVVIPLDFNSCFISYSSRDQEFAEMLFMGLQENGVRCWYAPESLKIGDKFRTSIDEAIHIHDRLLLVLSESSIQSPWVETEVESAFEKEHLQKRPVLFPIRLDDAVMKTDKAWAADIRRTRHIGDLTNWKHPGGIQKGLERLLRDLKTQK
jgi:hypothetical protein